MSGSIFCDLPPYAEREKKTSDFLENFFAFADCGNQTQAACAASECAVDYATASQLTFLIKKAELKTS